MSYDLAVWDGPRPQDDEQAGEVYDRLTEYFEDDDVEPEPATPPIREFIDELLERHPGLGSPGDGDSPWAVGPEPGDVNGNFVYLTLTFSGAQRSLEWIVATALRRGLVVYDPQGMGMR